MAAVEQKPQPAALSLRRGGMLALTGAVCFHAAYLLPCSGYAMLGFLACLLALTQVNNARHAFRWGIVMGWLTYVPHLGFFWKVFVPAGSPGGAKVIGALGVFALWMVLPIWLGLFLSLATWLRRWTKPYFWCCLIPVAWTGIEYFRSELYPLKFSWLSLGYAFAETPSMAPFRLLGMYGLGFVLMLLITFSFATWKRSSVGSSLVLSGAVCILIGFGLFTTGLTPPEETSALHVGGVQLEFPSNREVLRQLDRLVAQHPETELCVLSEYTFSGPIPDAIRNWCHDNSRYLIVGGKQPLGTTNFYNTVFVVGPKGEVIFRQVKSVPIQFFRDGLPAPSQAVWHSPWGRLGLCICYDLSYTRVTDGLVRKGAQAIIAPTMDVAEWGAYQHELHARVTPVRAAEYGIPIFRLTSSGISQTVLASGKVENSLPYPGQNETLTATLRLGKAGSLPLDRWLGPACVTLTMLNSLTAIVLSLRHHLHRRTKELSPA